MLNLLKNLLNSKDFSFWRTLKEATHSTIEVDKLLMYSNLGKKALKMDIKNPDFKKKIKVALIGAYSFYPMQELIIHYSMIFGFKCEVFVGEFDNYTSEILDENSNLYNFSPDFVVLFPSHIRCKSKHQLSDHSEKHRNSILNVSKEILELCNKLHQITKAEIILSNFILPPYFEPGPFRTKTLGSDWNFIRGVNMELGIKSPEYIHICDTDFLSCRYGLLFSKDEKLWFESKQLCSADLMVYIAKEISFIIDSNSKPMKKVIVLDLDNTIWGGVIGDDGMNGIDLGHNSPAGEAFLDFQKYIKSLTKIGVLLTVCSKNDYKNAIEPFEKHPEMVLNKSDIVSFKANWEPKSDNINIISKELNLGLDSFVFIDDNPAEIEIVNQFLPEVETITLDKDPSKYVAQLKDSRFFEPKNITNEDYQKTNQYKAETKRKFLQNSITNMDKYLKSLEMEGEIFDFRPNDIPRITQLINKSNQFNLTTLRRTESQIVEISSKPDFNSFSIRLRDKFGDYGLISVIITSIKNKILFIDTWIMSCRVLNRQVEYLAMNELVKIARKNKCKEIRGKYLRTKKNSIVKNHYNSLGFDMIKNNRLEEEFELKIASFKPFKTRIQIKDNSIT